MADNLDRNALTGAIADSISTVAAAIGFTGGFTYVAGYLVVNFYLSQYGVSTLSLVQSRYFAAGGLYLVVSALISAAPLLSLGLIDRTQSYAGAWQESRWKLLLLFASSLVLASVVIWLVRHVLTTIDDHMVAVPLPARRAALALSLPASQVALLFPAVVYFLARWGSRGKAPVGDRLGGGAPTQVELVLSQELTSRDGFPLEVSEGVTEPVLLLDQSANSLLVLQPDTGRVLEVSNDQVLAVVR